MENVNNEELLDICEIIEDFIEELNNLKEV